MLKAVLRRSGGSFILTLPPSYVEQNHLGAGSNLVIEINGDELKIKPDRPRPKLAVLLAATPLGLCRAKGWEGMGSAGSEL